VAELSLNRWRAPDERRCQARCRWRPAGRGARPVQLRGWCASAAWRGEFAEQLTLPRPVTVSVITNDGRNIVGILRGYDQTTNLIMEECHERVYSTTVRP